MLAIWVKLDYQNIMLFGEMMTKKPAHGPRKRWRDLASNDLKILGIDGWYGMNCVRIGTVGITDVGRGSLNYHHLLRVYVLPTGNLKADLSHVIVEELSAELETIQDIRSSAYHILNALPRLRYG